MTESDQQSPVVHFDITFPEGIPPIDFPDDRHSGISLARKAKRLGDRYQRFLCECFTPDADFFSDEEGFAIYFSLLGLTCEIYAKSILYGIQGASAAQQVRSHELSLLCKRMPDTLQNELKEDFNRLVPDKVFEDELKRIDQFFINFRYLYEIDGYSLNMNTPRIILEILATRADHITKQE